jgi:phosphoglycolate phosphatase-like HAD superfamily hydrolase
MGKSIVVTDATEFVGQRLVEQFVKKVLMPETLVNKFQYLTMTEELPDWVAKEIKMKFDVDMASSILIGDKESDIEAGLQAGIGTNILVRSGHDIIDEQTTKANLIIDSIKGMEL